LRECLIVFVMARWWRAVRCVYLRGRILPVSVTKVFMACGFVNGISAGVGVCCVFSVVLMAERKGDSGFGQHLVNR